MSASTNVNINSPSGTVGYQIDADRLSQKRHFANKTNSEGMSEGMRRDNNQSGCYYPLVTNGESYRHYIVNDMSPKYEDENKLDSNPLNSPTGTIGYQIDADGMSQKRHFANKTSSEGMSEYQSGYYVTPLVTNEESHEQNDMSHKDEDKNKLDSNPLNSPAGTIGYQIDEDRMSERKHFPYNSNSERTSDPEVKGRMSQRKHFPYNSNSERTSDPEVKSEKPEEQNYMSLNDDDENKVDTSTAPSEAGTIGYTIEEDKRSQKKHFPDKARSTIFNDN